MTLPVSCERPHRTLQQPALIAPLTHPGLAFHHAIQVTVMLKLLQFQKAADTLTIDKYLGHRTAPGSPYYHLLTRLIVAVNGIFYECDVFVP